MQFFRRLPVRLDVGPLRAAISEKPHLWNRDRLRTTHENTAHSKVDDIWLRYNAWENFDPEHPQDFGAEHETVNYPAWHELPAAQEIVFDLMPIVRPVRLGGVLITRVPAGCSIKPHADTGWHVEHYNRKVYVTLEGAPDQSFWAAAKGRAREVIEPVPGDVYAFDNRVVHGVDNDSDTDRMTLIICYRVDRE